MSYGKIDLDEIEIDPEKEKDIIKKFDLIDCNYESDFEEQIPFYY